MSRILIYDDDGRFADELGESLMRVPEVRDAFEVDTLDELAFKDTMQVLQDRQRALRKPSTWDGGRIPLDDASVLVVDFDLLDSQAGAFLTSELVAYLARCFSTCGLIVGLNLPPYRDNVFDLTLKGRPDSFADLNIGGNQLGNPNLWGGTKIGLHPWYWPNLPSYEADFADRIKDVRESLRDNVPICQVVGFPPEMFAMLPRSIGAFLGSKPTETTFREFVTRSGNGLRPKDATRVNDDVLARVGAARISKWLDRVVLSGQDILVDAPHTISRYPSLMTGDTKSIKTWNETARRTSHEELGLSIELIEPFRLKKSYWLSRPVWLWDQLRECQDILEVREPWQATRPEWVFCEDASRFYERRRCREFVADVESAFSRRFMRNFKGVNYRPIVRFSL